VDYLPRGLDNPVEAPFGPGIYTVALQVTDSNGLSSLSTLQLTVNHVALSVNAGSNLTRTAGEGAKKARIVLLPGYVW
jgi:PKD repeat protein